MAIDDGPLVVYGPRSRLYDFGDHHPLTPRRFEPGIGLLRSVGAARFLDPAPATDDELLAVHTRRYVDTVRRFSDEPWLPGSMGIGLSDNPAFPGMHEAAASVAGGSLAAMRAVLDGEVEHAHHPGGGLHHAMPERAWGFCIYDDPALAIAAARERGLRVLYVDLDVHHGDGVQAVWYRDPGVLTISVHESGRYLFPETGFPDELGDGPGCGTAVNLPFEPFAGEDSWLPAVTGLVPELAAAFGPDVVVSQHGADAHAWDPLAHLRVTTTAQWHAARMVDRLAHRYAEGRWLATGGGGYDVYRVVPRTWALTWLAGAHREPPDVLPEAWRERWAVDAERFGQSPIPTSLLDAPNAGQPASPTQTEADARSLDRAAALRAVVVPALIRIAVDRGWWRPDSGRPQRAAPVDDVASRTPTVVARLDAEQLSRARIAPGTAPLAAPEDLRAILMAAASTPGCIVTGALAGDVLVGLAVTAVGEFAPRASRGAPLAAGSRVAPPAVLAWVGVAPPVRRGGLGGAMLRAHLEAARQEHHAIETTVTVAERDWAEPLAPEERDPAFERLANAVGLIRAPIDPSVTGIDRAARRYRSTASD